MTSSTLKVILLKSDLQKSIHTAGWLFLGARDRLEQLQSHYHCCWLMQKLYLLGEDVDDVGTNITVITVAAIGGWASICTCLGNTTPVFVAAEMVLK